MTNKQLQMIHAAVRGCGLNDEQYRLMLFNVAGVKSSKDLSQAGFEDCMSTLEGCGFPGNYWTNRVTQRKTRASSRMVYLINERFAQYVMFGGKHQLAGFAHRTSGGKTNEVEKLTPRQAWNLIENLKALVSRQREISQNTAQQELFQ